MRKAFAPPAIHFKGTGWAKKERASASRTKAAAASESGSDAGDTGGKGRPEDKEGSPATAGGSQDKGSKTEAATSTSGSEGGD
jgi:hypothetical protein